MIPGILATFLVPASSFVGAVAGSLIAKDTDNTRGAEFFWGMALSVALGLGAVVLARGMS